MKFPPHLYFKFKRDLAQTYKALYGVKVTPQSTSIYLEDEKLALALRLWKITSGPVPYAAYTALTGLTGMPLRSVMVRLTRHSHRGLISRESSKERKIRLHKLADKKFLQKGSEMTPELKLVESNEDFRPEKRPDTNYRPPTLNSKMAELCQYYRQHPEANFEELADAYRSEIIRRHRAEWLEHAMIFDIGEIMATNNTAAARQAKLLAETIKIRQEGERLAWGLDDSPASVMQHVTPPVINIIGVAKPAEEKTIETVVTAPQELTHTTEK